MEKRKFAKNISCEYKNVNKIIKKQIREAKEWSNGKYVEIRALQKYLPVYRKIREIARQYKRNKVNDGVVIMNKEETRRIAIS